MTKKNASALHYLILFIIIVLTVYLRLHSLGEPLERDLASYAYNAHRMLSGEMLYAGVWDHKPPGIFGVYMLSELLWGYGPGAITYIGITFTLISLVFLFGFLTKLAGVRVALAGSLFWALASNSFLVQANQPNAELFMNTFLFISLWALVNFHEGKRGYLFLCGLFFAISSVFKTIAVFPFLAIAISLAITVREKEGGFDFKRLLRRLFFFGLPGLIVWAGFFSYFALSGRFEDFFEAVFSHNLYYSQNILQNIWTFFSQPRTFLGSSMIETRSLGVLTLLWFFLSRKEYGPLPRAYLVLLPAGLIVALASPGQFYMHYYQLLLPAFCILPALFISDIFRVLKGRGEVAASFVVVAVFLATAGYLVYQQVRFLKMTPNEISIKKYGPSFLQAKQMGLYMKEKTSPCETIYEWGKDTGIYFYSQRSAAAPVIFISHFFEGSPQGMLKRRRQTYESIKASPPAYIIYNTHTRWVDDDIFNDLLEERYEYIGPKFMRYLVYEHKFRGQDGKGDCPATQASRE